MDPENQEANNPAHLDQKELPAPPEQKALPAPAPRRRKWWWLAGLVVLGLALFFFFRYRSEKAAAAKQEAAAKPVPAAITVGQSKSGDTHIYVEALGTVTPIYTVTVYSQITGRVMGVYYTEGQMVKMGDPLVDIDPRPYQATLMQAEGTLEHDQGLLTQARIDLARYQAAYERNAISKQQLDDQEQLVVQYEGSVKADQGTVDYDKVQLAYCHIVAPITGRVGLRLVDPGNTVFSGNSSTLVVITQLQPITVVFNVSEDDLPEVQTQLRGGRTLQVAAFDRADEHMIENGTLTSLDNQVDTTTGTVKFRAEFLNKSLQLFPNQFVNARLLVQTLHNVTLVPSGAVQHNGTAAFVYMVKPDNTVAVQPVTVVTSNDQEDAVTGLNPGINVATSGFDRLENGVLVAANNGQEPAQNNQGHGSTAGTGGPVSNTSGTVPP